MRALISILLMTSAALAVSGCTSSSLRSSLGTAKNPWETFSEPPGSQQRTGRQTQANVNPFISTNYEILRKGAQAFLDGEDADAPAIRRYVSAGFALADHYCSDFFRDADESFRRRRFGRSLTNDVGGIINSILVAAGAGADAIGAVAGGFTSADSAWRNYDDAFMVDRNLANLRGLVLAAQDDFRARTLGTATGSSLPDDYGTAQSSIRRYAEFCSTLGMQSLLTTATERARSQQAAATDAARTGPQGQPNQVNGQARPAAPAVPAPPPLGTPPLTSNRPADPQ